MNLYLVYVKSSIDPLTGLPIKAISSFRVHLPAVPMSNSEIDDIRKALIGDSIGIWIRADDVSELESKLIESGFKTPIDFISNYSKVV